MLGQAEWQNQQNTKAVCNIRPTSIHEEPKCFFHCLFVYVLCLNIQGLLIKFQ